MANITGVELIEGVPDDDEALATLAFLRRSVGYHRATMKADHGCPLRFEIRDTWISRYRRMHVARGATKVFTFKLDDADGWSFSDLEEAHGPFAEDDEDYRTTRPILDVGEDVFIGFNDALAGKVLAAALLPHANVTVKMSKKPPAQVASVAGTLAEQTRLEALGFFVAGARA